MKKKFTLLITSDLFLLSKQVFTAFDIFWRRSLPKVNTKRKQVSQKLFSHFHIMKFRAQKNQIDSTYQLLSYPYTYSNTQTSKKVHVLSQHPIQSCLTMFDDAMP